MNICRTLVAAGAAFAAAHAVCAESAAPEGMKLFLCAGQSNMAGRGDVKDLTDAEKAPVPNVWYLDIDNEWKPADAPMHAEGEGRQQKFGDKVGIPFFFARAYAAKHPDEKIGIVPVAVGGTSIGKWRGPGKNNPEGEVCFAQAAKRIDVAKKNGTFAGILWHQGESDAAKASGRDADGKRTWNVIYDQKRYKSNFVKMLAALREKCGGSEYSPVVVAGELGPFTGGAKEFNAGLAEIAGRAWNCAVVSSEGTVGQRDELHFTTDDARKMGERYFEAFERQNDPKVQEKVAAKYAKRREPKQ